MAAHLEVWQYILSTDALWLAGLSLLVHVVLLIGIEVVEATGIGQGQ